VTAPLPTARWSRSTEATAQRRLVQSGLCFSR
jgi:hypothetical protein